MARDVVIGYCYGDHVTTPFHHSLLRTFIHDLCTRGRIANFLPVYATVNIGGPRNEVVRQFLATDAEWLWMLDTDAAFSHDLLHKLLDMADRDEYPIMGALAYRLKSTGEDGPTGFPVREFVPVAYQQIKDEEGNWVGYRELVVHSGDGLLEVDATGCHCLLVHRDVFTKMDAPGPYPWFRETILASGISAGEDITFCLAARDAGYPVYLDTRLIAGHAKMMIGTDEGAQ